MQWKPTSESEIWDQINDSWNRMSLPQRRLWEKIKTNPEKWELDPWGKKGGGFWVVAIYGNTVIWYNDIEEGFNRSTYNAYGRISEYWCNQDNLEWTLQHVLDEIREGISSGGYASPPQSLT